MQVNDLKCGDIFRYFDLVYLMTSSTHITIDGATMTIAVMLSNTGYRGKFRHFNPFTEVEVMCVKGIQGVDEQGPGVSAPGVREVPGSC